MNISARERLFAHGAHTLSHADLLALLLRTGNRAHNVHELAAQLLARLGNVHELACLSATELVLLDGIGPAKAASVIAACELARRLQSQPREHRAGLHTSEACYEQYRGQLQHHATERFLVVALDAKHRPLREELLSVGERLHTTVSPRKLFACAIACAAASVLVLHNHPSGDPEPSHADEQITAHLMQTGQLLDLPLLDHIIVGDDCYFSFRDEGFFDQPCR